MSHCERIVFRGRVQGVGFRATACGVARGYAVAGWVRNERDGSVLAMVEGAPAEVDRFVEAIQEALPGFVSGVERQPAEAEGCQGFGIRY